MAKYGQPTRQEDSMVKRELKVQMSQRAFQRLAPCPGIQVTRAPRHSPRATNTAAIAARMEPDTLDHKLDLLLSGRVGILAAIQGIARWKPELLESFVAMADSRKRKSSKKPELLINYLARVVKAEPSLSSLADFDGWDDRLPKIKSQVSLQAMLELSNAFRRVRNDQPKALVKMLEISESADYENIPMTAYLATLFEEAINGTLSIPAAA